MILMKSFQGRRTLRHLVHGRIRPHRPQRLHALVLHHGLRGYPGSEPFHRASHHSGGAARQHPGHGTKGFHAVSLVHQVRLVPFG